MDRLSIFMLTLVCGFQIGAVKSSGFRSTVSKWQKSFNSSEVCKTYIKETDNCQKQIQIAKNKGNIQLKDDIKAAVEMINIYSSNKPLTFSSANLVLRGDPDNKVDKKNVKMFKEFGRILQISIGLLCKQFPDKCGKHGPVYRGQGHCVTINCPSYTFDSFLSTSKKILVAEQFFKYCPKTSVLFRLEVVEGIYIRDFSEYPSEEEILTKPKAKFKIIKNWNSTKKASYLAKIKQKITSLGGKTIPKTYIVGTMSGLKRSITELPCAATVRSGATFVLSDSKYVGSALVIIVVYTYMNHLVYKLL